MLQDSQKVVATIFASFLNHHIPLCLYMSWLFRTKSRTKLIICMQDKFKGVVHPEPEASPAYMEEMPEPAELTWTDLTYCVKAGNPPRPKTVLQKCSGTLKPGESVALMGPSGAGKPNITCFLSTLHTLHGLFSCLKVNARVGDS